MSYRYRWLCFFFFFQAEDGIRDHCVTGVQTCALPIYARGDLRIADSLELHLVQVAQGIQRTAALRRIHPLRVGNKQDRLPLGTELNTLIYCGDESTTPAGLASVGLAHSRDQYHKPGKIAAFASQAVGQPGS